MTPYTVLAGLVSPQVQRDFIIAQTAFLRLPEATKENCKYGARIGRSEEEAQMFWTCHGITRMIGSLLSSPWLVIDGHYARRGNEHSWLAMMAENRDLLILDCYPIGSLGGPRLQVSNSFEPLDLHGMYIESSVSYTLKEKQKWDAEKHEAYRALFTQHFPLKAIYNVDPKLLGERLLSTIPGMEQPAPEPETEAVAETEPAEGKV
jgi:hypothetical protein